MKTCKKIKILTVSDFIDKSLTQMIENKTIEPVDLIISCGDLDPEFLSFLRQKLNKPLFYVKGNHDLRYTSSNPGGCENIHAKLIQFKSLNILGIEGSMWYNGGPNQYTEKEMKKIILKLWFPIWRKGGINIVVTHAPPKNFNEAQDRCHMGFESYLKLINKRKPDYFVHGHIHKHFKTLEERITKINGTKVINTCGFSIIEV